MNVLEVLPDLKDLEIFKTNLIIENLELTSLKGCPKTIKGYFDCKDNNLLTTLEFFPKVLGSSFSCENNRISSLKGLPKIIDGDFDCSNNLLKDLKYCPKIIKGHFHFNGNPDLKNVKEQIIKYQIKAKYYYSDEELFKFEDIKEEFKNYEKEQKQKEKTIKKYKSTDYGLGF